MTQKNSQARTALQKLKAKQKAQLSEYKRGSPAKSRAKERHKEQIQNLKDQQALVARARAALPKSQRKKLKPVRDLSPETIKKEAAKVKRQGAKLQRKRDRSNPLQPPRHGYTTSKIFDIPSQQEAMKKFLNRVFHVYVFTGEEDGQIRGVRAVVHFSDGSVMSTGVLEPTWTPDKDSAKIFFVDQIISSDPMVAPEDLKVLKIEIIVSWNRDYLEEVRRYAI